MTRQPASTDRIAATPTFKDGLGTRVRVVDAGGDPVEHLQLVPEIAAQESALRDRVGRLINFRHARYVRLRGVDRAKGGQSPLVVAYDALEGHRLSTVLESLPALALSVDVDVALQIVRDLLPAIGILHDSRKVTHGAIAPERLVYTSQQRLVIVDHGLGAALMRMNLPRKKLWEQFRIASPATNRAAFDEKMDIVQIGLVALALVLGRPLTDEEYPAQIKRVIFSVKETSSRIGSRPIGPELRRWLERATGVDEAQMFATIKEAQDAFETVVAVDRYSPTAAAVKGFFLRYDQQIARTTPAAAAVEAVSSRSTVDVDSALSELQMQVTIAPRRRAAADPPPAATEAVEMKPPARGRAKADTKAEPAAKAEPAPTAETHTFGRRKSDRLDALQALQEEMSAASGDITAAAPTASARQDDSERLAREAAERGRQDAETREQAEREGRALAEQVARDAADQVTREAAERAAAERQARAASEREATERGARQEAERQAHEASLRATREAAEREVAQRAARDASAREESERDARKRLERESIEGAERRAREQVEREAAEQAAQARREEEARERDARAAATTREAVEQARQEAAAREAEAVGRVRQEAAREAEAVEQARREAAAREAAERQAREQAERESRANADRAAKEAAERAAAERAAREAAARAEKEATDRVAAERVAKQAAERADRAERESAERAERALREANAREAAERQARELAERALKEAADRAAAEQAARESAERAAHEAAERAAAERAAVEAAQRAEREAADRETAERAAREAEERAAREATERAAAEQAARQSAEREAAHKVARELAEQAVLEAAEREATHRLALQAAELAVREAAERADVERAARQAAEQAAREASQRALADLVAQHADARGEFETAGRVAAERAAREHAEAAEQARLGRIQAEGEAREASERAQREAAERAAAERAARGHAARADAEREGRAAAEREARAAAERAERHAAERHAAERAAREAATLMEAERQARAAAEQAAREAGELAAREAASREAAERAAREAAELAADNGTRRRRRKKRPGGRTPEEASAVQPMPSSTAASAPAPATFGAAPEAPASPYVQWQAGQSVEVVPAWARGAGSGGDAAAESEPEPASYTPPPSAPIGDIYAAPPAEASASILAFKPAPPPETWMHRSPQTLSDAETEARAVPPGPTSAPRRAFRINWARTLAASLLVALLEGVAFATAWWYVTPEEQGWLVVHTKPAGIQIAVDGMVLGKTPFAQPLAPGRHTIELRYGTGTRVVPVEISAGVQTEQRLSWGNGFTTGQAAISSSTAGSKVFINGRLMGKTPLTVSDLLPGKHEVTVEGEKGSVSTMLMVEAGQTTELDVPVYAGWASVLSPVQLDILLEGKLVGSTEIEKLMLRPGKHTLELVNESLGYRGAIEVRVRPGATTSVSVVPKTPVTVEAPEGTELSINGENMGTLPNAHLQVPLGTAEFVMRYKDEERRQVMPVTMSAPVTVKYELSPVVDREREPGR